MEMLEDMDFELKFKDGEFFVVDRLSTTSKIQEERYDNAYDLMVRIAESPYFMDYIVDDICKELVENYPDRFKESMFETVLFETYGKLKEMMDSLPEFKESHKYQYSVLDMITNAEIEDIDPFDLIKNGVVKAEDSVYCIPVVHVPPKAPKL